jgi:hypothetical protein
VTYRVNLHPDVQQELLSFTSTKRHYFDLSREQIAADPSARQGTCAERVLPFLPVPRRMRRFEITREISISGEHVWVFLADFFPDAIAYLIKDYDRSVQMASGYAGEALVIGLRPDRARRA